MDAYDDFDPQQYDYGDSDEDIVYLEGDQQHDVFLPQHQQSSQAFSQSSPSALNTKEQASPARIPLNLLPRQERKRRRRMEVAARAARGADDDASSYDSSDHEEEEPQEEASEPGAFASLQELLQKAAESPAKASQETGESPQAMEADDLQEQPEAQAEAPQLPVPPPPESQPEFPQPDDEVDWQVSQQQQGNTWETAAATSHEMHNFYPPTMMPRSRPWEDLAEPSESLERELKRQRNHQQKKSTAHFSDPSAPSHNSSLLSELEKNRKLAASERKRTAAAPRAKKTRQPPPRQQPQPSLSQPVQSEASSISIVGSRPQHWGSRRGGLLSQPGAAASAKPRTRKQQGKLQRAINAKVQSKRGRSLLSALNSKTPFSSLRGQQEKRAAPQASPRTSEENTEQGPGLDLANASFAPSFLTGKRRQTETDEVEDTATTQPPCGLSQRTPLPRSMFSPTRPTNTNGSAPASHRRTKKLKAGPLMKRLRVIRGSLQGDKVRFQSGMYPFPRSGISLDRNDPRRRASRYMDVTIVGNPIPWEKEQAHVTALGYVHAISATSTKHESTKDKKIDPFFAWISFTFETAREQKLQRGMQFRIYDAICVSLKEGTRGDLCSQIVVCTQLCEPYPSVLPGLEAPPGFAVVQEDAM